MFAPDAICLTSVPATVIALTQQRFRWERDAVRLRYRKHRDLMNPFSARFKIIELLHEMDFVLFNIVAAVAFPFYLMWLFITYGDIAPIILVGAQMGMLALDTFTFFLAAWLTPQVNSFAFAPYIVGYSLFYSLIMRFIRLAAYLQEWVFRSSYRDLLCADESSCFAEIAMRPLRKLIRPDNIPNERRVSRGAAGRVVYLVLLTLFGVAIINYLFGDFVLLRADGLVLRDENVVATTYIARVESVFVQQGETIKEGRPLLKLQSLEILERLADLSIKRAELVAKVTDLRVRSETVEQLSSFGGAPRTRIGASYQTIRRRNNGRAITSVRWEQALRANYDALRDRVRLSAESHVLSEEVKAVQIALADADTALADLKAHYADGEVLAPVGGSIGVAVPYVGNVYRPGDPMLSIYSGDPYVLAYLPRRYLFPIYVGMQIRITDGQNTESGVVSQILPVTATLPKEFQNTFQPSDRNQLAKVKLPGGSHFPLNQKVSVSRGYF